MQCLDSMMRYEADSQTFLDCGAVEGAGPKPRGLFRSPVNPTPRKYSTLPKFGLDVYVAHPGSFSRGDRVVVMFASRACGGRGSVGRERSGAGRIALREPLASRGRTALPGFVSSASFRLRRQGRENCGRNGGVVRTAKPCGPGRRCYGQALANAAVASTGAVPVTFAGAREARRNSAPGRARHKSSDHRAGKAE